MGVIRQANVGGFLHKDIETYGNLSLTEAGKKFLEKACFHHLRQRARLRVDDSPDDEAIVARGGGSAGDEKLMKMLRDLRHTMAKS
jgi:ATP-dependent DNA helicase RecQ